MTDDAHVGAYYAHLARLAVTLWEADPRRQAMARMLGIPPGAVSDDMVRRALRSTLNLRNPPMQQLPRRGR